MECLFADTGAVDDDRACYHLHYGTASLRTKILDLRGFDSRGIFILRGGIPRPTGDLPESLGQRILVGTILVERLGICCGCRRRRCLLSLGRRQLPSAEPKTRLD